MRKRLTTSAVGVVLALTATPAAAEDSKQPTPLPCLKISNQESRDTNRVDKTRAALKKAKTSRGKARLRKQLATARKRQASTKRRLTKCVKDNVIRLSESRVPVGEGFVVTVSAPEPRAGQHYRVVVYAGMPADDDLSFSCALIERKDWVSPTGIALMSPYSLTGWCPGTGSVVLMSVPDGAPDRYTGSTVARKPITFVP